MSEQVELLLKQLRLPTFIRYYHEIWQEASDQGWSHPEYLMYLCEKEVADRYQRRVKNWMKDAKFPRGKSFVTLDLQPLDDQSKSQLARLQQDTDWVTTADNVLLIGPSGVGKTPICCSDRSSPDRAWLLMQVFSRSRIGPAASAGQTRSRTHGSNEQTGSIQSDPCG